LGSLVGHPGHHRDLVAPMKGSKHVGLTGKLSTPKFPENRREEITKRQFGKDVDVKAGRTLGGTIGDAIDKAPEGHHVHLHVHLGHDRAEMGKKMVDEINSGRLKEVRDRPHRKITAELHLPKEGRGYSGTEMRNAALNDKDSTFEKKYFPHHSPEEASSIKKDMASEIRSGHIPTKRKS